MTINPSAFRRSLTGLAIMLLLVLCLQTPALAASTDPIGQVVSMTGSVTAGLPDGDSRALDLDSPVHAGEVLVTGPASNVEIRLLDETILAQGPDSTITLDDYVFSTDSSASKLLFKMGTGTFRFLTGEIVKQNPGAFKLETPMTQIGIRGTEPIAVVGPTETIGLLSIDPAHTMEVTTSKGTRSMNQPGTSVSVGRDGSISLTAKMSPAVQKSVMQAAPMTTQGEVGSKGRSEDMDRKVKAFKQNIAHTKGSLGGVSGGSPDYGKLHSIHMQTKGQETAESQRDGTDASISTTGGSGSDSGGSSGGSGGGGGCH